MPRISDLQPRIAFVSGKSDRPSTTRGYNLSSAVKTPTATLYRKKNLTHMLAYLLTYLLSP